MVFRRIAVGVLLLVIPVGAIFFVAKGRMSYLASEGTTVREYLRAIGSGKPAQACAMPAEQARIKLMAERKPTPAAPTVEGDRERIVDWGLDSVMFE